MTAHTIVSRPLTALSAILTLATGFALTAAPSTAQAETRTQIVMNDGNVDCPPCRLIRVDDQEGLTFHDVAAELQGDRIVITAEVTMTGTARPRTGSVVFSAYVHNSTNLEFMDYTDDACTPSLMSRQAGDQACAALSRALHQDSTAPVPTIDGPAAPAEGIIMKDGGICDPIRHMGC